MSQTILRGTKVKVVWLQTHLFVTYVKVVLQQILLFITRVKVDLLQTDVFVTSVKVVQVANRNVWVLKGFINCSRNTEEGELGLVYF